MGSVQTTAREMQTPEPTADSPAPISRPPDRSGDPSRQQPLISDSPSSDSAVRGRPLRRYPDRGLLGGVCAGLADHLGVELPIVRLLTAMVVAFGGIGVAIYAIAWALIPVAPESEGLGRRPGAWREAVLIVVGVAGLLVGLRLLGLARAGAVIWPLVVGVWRM